MLKPSAYTVLKRATGDAAHVATSAGRPGKWVVTFSAFDGEQAIRQRFAAENVAVIDLEQIDQADYVAVVDLG